MLCTRDMHLRYLHGVVTLLAAMDASSVRHDSLLRDVAYAKA